MTANNLIPQTKAPEISFGTDGWRAIIGEKFTYENLEIVAQAYADYLNLGAPAIDETVSNTQLSVDYNLFGRLCAAETASTVYEINYEINSDDDARKKLVFIGYDCRFQGANFAKRVAEVLRGNGIEVELFDEPVPTPLVSWAVREAGASGGIVITASHNPAEYNGFKIKAAFGGSAPPEITRAVEGYLHRRPVRKQIGTESSKTLIEDSLDGYRAQIENFFDLEKIRAESKSIVIDSMHGSGGRWIESFLKGGRLTCETIRASADPLFGGVNPEPIDRNLEPLKKRVRENNALLGLATDGDADRLGCVSNLGETMTMHEVVPLILLHLIRARKLTGGIVRTFSKSVLTKRIAAAYGLPVYETAIGFKYVADLMLEKDILIGAEESGGIGVKGHLPERDGIFNSLLFLETVIASGISPSEMVRKLHHEFGEFHYDRRDLSVEINFGRDLVAGLAAKSIGAIAGSEISDIETRDGTKLMFKDDSWLLFRQSGTEPVLRVYCEATSKEKRDRLLNTACLLANQSSAY